MTYMGYPRSTPGRFLFQWLAGVQSVLLLMIAPAVTASAFTAEREHRSMELLVSTPLRAGTVAFGKFFAALAFVLLLMLIGLPLTSVCFLLGGVSPTELLVSYCQIGATAALYASFGLFWSASVGRTVLSTALTYLCAFTHFFGTLITSAFGYGMSRQGAAIFSLNPIMALHLGSESTRILGMTLTAGTCSVALTLLAALLAARSARGQLREFQPSADWQPRFIGALSIGSFWLVLTAALWVPGGRAALSQAQFVPQSLLLITMAVAVWLGAAYAERLRSASLSAYLWQLMPWRAFHQSPGSAISFISLCVLTGYAAILTELEMGALTPPGGSTVPLLAALAVTLSVGIGMAGLGNLLAVTLGSSVRALVAGALFLVTLWIVALLAAVNSSPGALDLELARFMSPFSVLSNILDPDTSKREAVWRSTFASATYLVLGLICVAGTIRKLALLQGASGSRNRQSPSGVHNPGGSR